MSDFLISCGYSGLFLVCFLAATILPFSSDVIFGAVIAGGLEPVKCLIIASLANFLGGMTNYFLGLLGKTEWIEKYLKVKHEKVVKMQDRLNNKGAYMAFFSFVPFVGDIIPLALGYMRANIYRVSISMLTGKFLRYWVIMYFIEKVI
ncbi:MAG: DedA family protein [Prevotellaceae bacterium]|nr:DedA family protein [Prevotellaceae bacterium]